MPRKTCQTNIKYLSISSSDYVISPSHQLILTVKLYPSWIIDTGSYSAAQLSFDFIIS